MIKITSTIVLLFVFILLVGHNKSFADIKLSTNLVKPVSYFVDHIKQLNELKDNLAKYNKGSLVGTSGIGKTQLARTYAYDNKQQYKLIWFFDCNLDLNQQFVKLVKELNKTTKANLSEDPKLAKREIMDYLGSKNDWLFVFDNLKIGNNNSVKDIVYWEHDGHIIFVSQDQRILPHIIELSVFDTKDSSVLASGLLKNKNDIDFLVKNFGNYPILIVQGAQLLNQIKGLDKDSYKEEIVKSMDKIKLNVELAIRELKPTTIKLLEQIALINNQGFSKNLLKIISVYPDVLDDDILQLSKFMLIANVDANENNPVFEMHDIIAQKVAELNEHKKNTHNLEEIITRLMNAVPKSVLKGRIFRNSKTMIDNFIIILRNSEKYNVNIYRIMELNSNLGRHYNNSLDYDNAKKKIEWFEKNDQEGRFKPLLMDNNEKSMYASYLSMIGHYYRHKEVDYNKAIGYFVRSSEVFDEVKGYDSYKFNINAQLTVINATLGQVQEAEKNIIKLEEILHGGLIDKLDMNFMYTVKAKLLFMQGRYYEALELVDKFIKIFGENGLKSTDLFLTNSYLLRSEILNFLEMYQEAYEQTEMLYEMHKLVKREDHEIFARIYTQMARSELGLDKIGDSKEHITKAIGIFFTTNNANSQKDELTVDPDLASSYVVKGDIFVNLGVLESAIESYRDAQKIYFYLYKNNIGNVAYVSELYLKGAKAACKLRDLYHYKAFGLPQVREFGDKHFNTIAMFEYCKQQGMDLWSER